MNLQFSISTNTMNSNTSNVSLPSENAASTVRSEKQLSVLEKQGMHISSADEHLIRAIEKAIKAMQGPTTTMEVSVHEKTHQIMVKVLNKENGELIREIPPEKTLDIVAKMMEIAGILIDEKV
ncbi:flagellar protein FlaG [Paenibacillus urinalis]|uniref:flagellar protein FlaG n=1 Tax=Paenibacillus urinalis TaxID=521520 RepID=UPI00195FF537